MVYNGAYKRNILISEDILTIQDEKDVLINLVDLETVKTVLVQFQ